MWNICFRYSSHAMLAHWQSSRCCTCHSAHAVQAAELSHAAEVPNSDALQLLSCFKQCTDMLLALILLQLQYSLMHSRTAQHQAGHHVMRRLSVDCSLVSQSCTQQNIDNKLKLAVHAVWCVR